MHPVSEMDSHEVLLRFVKERPFALRGGEAIYPPRLAADLTRAAALVGPAGNDVLVTCKGRYEFSVALLSIWQAGKNAILPPNLHPATLERIRSQHAISVELNDGFIEGGKPLPVHDERELFEFRFSRAQQALTIYTSGSTGSPKPVLKSIGNIFAEAFALQKAMPWPEMPLVASVPPHHLYGLTFSILLPWVLAVPMVDECPLHADEVVEAIERNHAGILITVPVHLRALLEQKISCRPVMAISSAGALDPAIAAAWQQRFGREIVEIYGSSETGVIASRQQMSHPGWAPFSEVSVSSSDAGMLRVASPFINASEGELFQTQDLVTLQGEAGFLLHGRADSIVKIAGRRVSLLVVEAAIKRCDGVLDAAVIAVPVQGHIRDVAIWAAVATGEATAINARSIRAQLLPQLDGIKIPRRIVVVKQLPRETSGKLSRERLLALFQESAQP